MNFITTVEGETFSADATVFTYTIQPGMTIMAESKAIYIDQFNFPSQGSGGFIHILTVRRIGAAAAAIVTSGSTFLYSHADSAITGSPSPSIQWSLNANVLELHVITPSASPSASYTAEIKLTF